MITYLQCRVSTDVYHKGVAPLCFIPATSSLEHWRRSMQFKVRLLFALAAAAAGTVAIAGPKAEPGECGQYLYWHDGECTDARDKKSTKSWADESWPSTGSLELIPE